MECPTISVCIMCRDEEKVIRECLESVKDIADEIVILDTGSVDNTIEIAKEYTNKVYEYVWEEDFSKGRNKLLSYATKDWILVLDCDETLCNITKEQMINHINDENFDGYCLRVLSLVENGLQEHSIFRLFRNLTTCKYKNRLHEQIIQCFQKSRVGSANISINHIGYTEEVIQEKDKDNRNSKILNSYEQEEKDCFYYYCVGNECLSNGRWKDAVDRYLYCLSILNDEYGFFQHLILNLGKAYYLGEQYDQVIFLAKSFKMFMVDIEEFVRITMKCEDILSCYKE